MTIKPATKNNYAKVMLLYNQFIGEITGEFKRFNDKNEDSFNKILEDPDAFIDLAYIDDETVGFVAYSMRNLIRYPKSIVEIEELFVQENYRKKGIGKKLVNHVISFAKKRKCQQVMLGSGLKLKGGHEFYKKLDFEDYEYRFRFKLD